MPPNSRRDGAAELYPPGGRPPVIGDVIHQPALAQTLERIAKHGRSAFYEERSLAKLWLNSPCGRRGPYRSRFRRARQRDGYEPISTRFIAITMSMNVRRMVRSVIDR